MGVVSTCYEHKYHVAVIFRPKNQYCCFRCSYSNEMFQPPQKRKSCLGWANTHFEEFILMLNVGVLCEHHNKPVEAGLF